MIRLRFDPILISIGLDINIVYMEVISHEKYSLLIWMASFLHLGTDLLEFEVEAYQVLIFTLDVALLALNVLADLPPLFSCHQDQLALSNQQGFVRTVEEDLIVIVGKLEKH